jgi:hypothetical protein
MPSTFSASALISFRRLGPGKTKKRLGVGVAAVFQTGLSDDNGVIRYFGGAGTGQLFLKLGDPSLQLADLEAFVATTWKRFHEQCPSDNQV